MKWTINTELLTAKIEEKGLKYNFIAKQLGLSNYGFAKKVNNDTEFKVSEVVKITELLGLTKKERDLIFFGNSVH